MKIEIAFGEDTLKRVEKLGHKTAPTAGFGACQAIYFDCRTRLFHPAHDPRVPGKADGR